MQPAHVEVDQKALLRIAREYGLDLIVLFGSRAKGRSRPGSDIDLAVRKIVRRKEGTVEDETDRDLWLIGELAKAVRASDGDIDVVFLNQASPLLLFQVACHGRVLYEAEPFQFACFKSYAARVYDTDRKFIDAQRRYLRRNFLHV